LAKSLSIDSDDLAPVDIGCSSMRALKRALATKEKKASPKSLWIPQTNAQFTDRIAFICYWFEMFIWMKIFA